MLGKENCWVMQQQQLPAGGKVNCHGVRVEGKVQVYSGRKSKSLLQMQLTHVYHK